MAHIHPKKLLIIDIFPTAILPININFACLFDNLNYIQFFYHNFRFYFFNI